VVHLNDRDVTFLAISSAPQEKLQAYKREMDWRSRWASSFDSDYHLDFAFALSDEQTASDWFTELVNEAPDWLREWGQAVGTDLAVGLREGPGWATFVLKDGVVYPGLLQPAGRATAGATTSYATSCQAGAATRSVRAGTTRYED
jgi:predicted dithiol-disulfide oxidoreductase (DUF899 family)